MTPFLSHPVVAQCDKQATVVGRLLTTLEMVDGRGEIFLLSPKLITKFQRK